MENPGPGPHLDDLQLARDVLSGSETAQRTFLERMECVPLLLNGRDRRFGNGLGKEALEDAIQEALMAIWRQLPNYDGRAVLEAWAHGFCRTEYLRARSRLGRDRLRPSSEPPEKVDPHSLPPADNLGETLEGLTQALDRLDSRTATLVRMRHTEKKTFEELGRSTGLATKTARNLYYLGIRRLREILGVPFDVSQEEEAQ